MEHSIPTDFMVLEGLLTCSQDHVICFYYEPHESSSHNHTLFLYDLF